LVNFVVLSAFVCGVCAHSTHFYDMIEDINRGVNYYTVLGIKSSATDMDIKKAHRSLAMKYHPDKNPEGAEVYLKIQRAREILEDPQTRKEYDKLLVEGIPWQEQYYGKYMHKFNIPQHDIRVVLAWFLVICTICKYLYQLNRYNQYIERAKASRYYQVKMNMFKKEKEFEEKEKEKGKESGKDKETDTGPKNRKKDVEEKIDKNKTLRESAGQGEEGEGESESENDLEIRLTGYDKPTWKDILIIQIVILPYTIGKTIYRFVKPLSVEEQEQLICEKNGWTKEEFKEKKRQYEEYWQKKMQSPKYKRARRMWKKHLWEKGQ